MVTEAIGLLIFVKLFKIQKYNHLKHAIFIISLKQITQAKCYCHVKIVQRSNQGPAKICTVTKLNKGIFNAKVLFVVGND